MREQANRRASRHATTLPLLAAMTVAGVSAEISLLADDHEALLHAVGVPARSPLRGIAEHLPHVVETFTGMVVRSERSWADLLARIADTERNNTQASDIPARDTPTRDTEAS